MGFTIMKRRASKKTKKQPQGVSQILKNLQAALQGASKNLNALKPRLSSGGLVKQQRKREPKSDLPKPLFGFDVENPYTKKKKSVSTQTFSEMGTQTQ